MVVIPAQAGIQQARIPYAPTIILDAGFHRHDGRYLQHAALKFPRAPMEMSWRHFIQFWRNDNL